MPKDNNCPEVMGEGIDSGLKQNLLLLLRHLGQGRGCRVLDLKLYVCLFIPVVLPEPQYSVPKAMFGGLAPVPANVNRDGVEPGRKTTLKPEAFDSPERFEESLLCALFGITAIAEQPVTQIKYAVLVVQYQPVQARAISQEESVNVLFVFCFRCELHRNEQAFPLYLLDRSDRKKFHQFSNSTIIKEPFAS